MNPDSVVELYREPQFRFSPTLSDVAQISRHNSILDSLHYIPSLDGLLAVERTSGLVKIYDAGSFELRETLMLPRGAPTAAHYIAELKAIVFSFGDTIMGVWDLNRDSPTFKEMKCGSDGRTPICWPAAEVQLSIQWISKHNLLYSGSRDGLVQAWNINERREEKINDRPLVGHADMVMDLHYLDRLDTMASASLDSNICIWDLYTGRRQHVLRGHRLGVSSLAYCADRRLLVSAGFDHEALVWSPFGSSQIFSLKGHMTSLVGVDVIGDSSSNQILTVDSDGIQKIWDVRKFQCLQTIDTSFKDTSTFCYVPPIKTGSRKRTAGVVTGTKSLHVFKQDVATGQGFLSLTDDKPVNHVRVIAGRILTINDRSVKVWNLQTGKLEEEFRNVVPSDITAVCVVDDGRPGNKQGLRELVVGLHDGQVLSFSMNTGMKSKEYFAHTSEIVSLLYHPFGGGSTGGEPSRATQMDSGLMLSSDWNGTVILHDVGSREGGADAVVRSMDPSRTLSHTDDITAMAFFAPRQLSKRSRRARRLAHRRSKDRHNTESQNSSTSENTKSAKTVSTAETAETDSTRNPQSPETKQASPSDLEHDVHSEDDAEQVSTGAGNVVSRMLVATAGAEHVIKTWHARDGKLADVIALDKGYITSMVFLEPYPLLVASSSTGVIHVWGTSGGKYAGQEVLSFTNVMRRGIPIVVVTLQWDCRSQTLFTANEDSDIYALDMRELLARLDFDSMQYAEAAEEAAAAAREEEQWLAEKAREEAEVEAAALLAAQMETEHAATNKDKGIKKKKDSAEIIGSEKEQKQDDQVDNTGDNNAVGSVENMSLKSSKPKPTAGAVRRQVHVPKLLTSINTRLLSSSGIDSKVPLRPPSVKWHEPQAHNDLITSMVVVPRADPPVLLTSSIDRHVKMWSTRPSPSVNAIFLGALRQGGNADMTWARVCQAAASRTDGGRGNHTGSDFDVATNGQQPANQINSAQDYNSRGSSDSSMSPELSDLKTQLYFPKTKKMSIYHEDSDVDDNAKVIPIMRQLIPLMPTKVSQMRASKLPNGTILQNTSLKFQKQQSEYLKLNKKHAATSKRRSREVDFDESHALIRRLRVVFTQWRKDHSFSINGLRGIFEARDPSKSGTLPRPMFHDLLKEMNCQFTEENMETVLNMLTTRSGEVAYKHLLEVTNLSQKEQELYDETLEARKVDFKRKQAIATIKQKVLTASMSHDLVALQHAIDQANEIGAHAQARIATKLLNQLEED